MVKISEGIRKITNDKKQHICLKTSGAALYIALELIAVFPHISLFGAVSVRLMKT